MILDGKLAGTLDQGAGCLDVFEDAPADAVYPAALSTFDHVGRAIDNLIARSHKIAV
jgi:26S proteasome regulatory subunit N6